MRNRHYNISFVDDCFDDCSGNNGVCTVVTNEEPKECVCQEGFTGDNCGTSTCPGLPVPCTDSSKGTCPSGGTACQCSIGWTESDCAKQLGNNIL